mmetsp:Transcript_14681/g.16291  ORF Transcript_14681/g.16291 Transcript_14681/m.16291 type:complete len:138 (-) Transcript_14681:57-470(-)
MLTLFNSSRTYSSHNQICSADMSFKTSSGYQYTTVSYKIPMCVPASCTYNDRYHIANMKVSSCSSSTGHSSCNAKVHNCYNLYKSSTGYQYYHHSNSAVIVGIVFGVLGGIILFVSLTIFFIRRMRKKSLETVEYAL